MITHTAPVIETVHLFPVLNGMLTGFLKQLNPDDWQLQTVARLWKVKDVAAHMLDVNIRRISIYRDGWMSPPETPISSYNDLVDYLNGLNADWVKALKRMSPAMITEWLETTNDTVYRHFQELDPFGQAVFSVAWAGEVESRNWFDIAREYTERWIHQQQIRDACGNSELLAPALYRPFLEVVMRAWPYTLRDTDAPDGTVLKAVVTGAGGGEWFLRKETDGWALTTDGTSKVAAQTTIDGNEAWKLFSKSRRAADLKDYYSIEGEEKFGAKLLDMVSFMA